MKLYLSSQMFIGPGELQWWGSPSVAVGQTALLSPGQDLGHWSALASIAAVVAGTEDVAPGLRQASHHLNKHAQSTHSAYGKYIMCTVCLLTLSTSKDKYI